MEKLLELGKLLANNGFVGIGMSIMAIKPTVGESRICMAVAQ